MPAHPELRLIGRIVGRRDFRTVLQRKIVPKMFGNTEARIMFNYIWDYYHNTRHPGAVPTKAIMRSQFPSVFDPRTTKSKESIAELAELLKEQFLTSQLQKLNDEVAAEAASRPYKALEKLRTESIRLHGVTAHSKDLLLSDASDALIKEYDTTKNSEGLVGVPWPWDPLNDVTGGMTDEDFILIYGRLKNMKSFIGILVGVHAYYAGRRRVMFYSAEMNPLVVAKRAAACLCELDYKQVRRATLKPHKERLYKSAVMELKDIENDRVRRGSTPAFMIAANSDDANGKGSVMHVEAKAHEFEPDLIIVDSFYRLGEDYDWKVQGKLSKDLKSLAQRLGVPIIGITQASRHSKKKGIEEGMEDLSFADVGGQETDFGIRLIKGPKDHARGGNWMYAVVAAAREIEQSGFILRFRPYLHCDWYKWMEEQDIKDIESAEKARIQKEHEDKMSAADVRSDDKFLQNKRQRMMEEAPSV